MLVLLGTIGSAGYRSASTAPTYQAEVKLLVGVPQFERDELSQGAALVFLSRQLQATYAHLSSLRSVAELAVQTESLDIRPTEIVRGISATIVKDTQLIDMVFISTDPVLAQNVANGVARALVATVASEQATSEVAIPVRIVEPALTPTVPVGPNHPLNLFLGVLFGLMLAVSVALGLEFVDTTVRSREDAEEAASAPVLASVPPMNTQGTKVHLETDVASVAAESFRKLRTALQFLAVGDQLRCVLVTSARAAEGKTTVALNLAAAYAQGGSRTILIEADLRRPTLSVFNPAQDGQGLTLALAGRIHETEAIRDTGLKNLSVITAGVLPPNPAELLSSDRMVALLSWLKDSFDFVVVDAPPLLPVTDASVLASRVDGVVLVARAGASSRDALAEAAKLVHSVGGRLLGVALNDSQIKRSEENYGYYQRHAAPESKPT